MSLLFKQWLDPLVDRSLTSVTKTKVFLRNSSAKSSNILSLNITSFVAMSRERRDRENQQGFSG